MRVIVTGPMHTPPMTRWNPWRALREREAIRFALDQLPDGIDGVHGQRGERRAIIVDRSLHRIARNAVLAHELIHDERGHSPSSHPIEVAKEEERVEREVARRLVPFDELSVFVAGRLALGESVSAADIAEHFEVPKAVAQRAARMASHPATQRIF